MKHLFLFFLLITLSVKSQDFSKVDQLVSEYPRFSTVEALASKIEKDFTTDEEKARAAFFWLAKNIRYNLKEFYNPTQRSYNFSYTTEAEKVQKFQEIKNNLVSETFRNKTGVCEEYAQSFKKICDLLHIESEVIKGNVRNDVREIGNISNTTNHAWNAVKLNNKWVILDATWAAGYILNGKWIRDFNTYFYNIPTDKIFKTHFPESAIWVLRFGRMSLSDFFNQPIYDQNFLARKATVVSPKKGIIEIDTSKEIILKIKDLKPNSSISYNFIGERYSKKPSIIIHENITEIKIENPQRNSNLIIFIDKVQALQYKVIVR